MQPTSNKSIEARLLSAERRLSALEYISEVGTRRCFLAQDHEDRWYVIPVDCEDEWDELVCLMANGEAMQEEWHLFEDKYGGLRLRHDLSTYSFLDFRQGHTPRE